MLLGTEKQKQQWPPNKLQDILSFGLGMAGRAMGNTMPVAGIFEKAPLCCPTLRLAGGTNKIIKDVIAERVLGLPQDPRADKGLPFRDIPNGYASDVTSTPQLFLARIDRRSGRVARPAPYSRSPAAPA